MKSSLWHGFLVIDKPAGLTSRDVVNRAQTWFPRGTKVGHTGTLDPLATGVLVLAIGSGTRLVEYVQDMDKVYEAEVMLGARSDTDDADGTLTPIEGAVPPDRPAIDQALAGFRGEIDQVPPAFSAAKITGHRAYALARRGRPVVLQPRRVRVYRIDVRSYTFPRLELEVHCGKGTYIRSLARDLGDRLGCGGYISQLRRIRVGPFRAEDAVLLDANRDAAKTHLLPLEAAVTGLPRVNLEGVPTEHFRQGRPVPLAPTPPGPVAVFHEASGILLGVGEIKNDQLQPQKVISSEEGKR